MALTRKVASAVFRSRQMRRPALRRVAKRLSAGDYATSDLQDKLMPLHQAIFTEPGLVGAKYAMSQLGLCSDEAAAFDPARFDGTKSLIRDALRHAGLLN